MPTPPIAQLCHYSDLSTIPLLDSDRLGQVTREVDIQSFKNCKPVRNELQGNHVQQTLEAIDSLGNFDLLSLRGLELVVSGVADDNRLATTGNDYMDTD